MTENLPVQQQEKDNYVFASENSFVVAQRMAAPLAKSNLVPSDYRDNVGNCLIALEIAQRLKASPLMIMQNLYVIEGRPSWSAQFLIATINACGRYSPLRFEMKDKGEKEVECVTEYKWTTQADGRKRKEPIMGKLKIHDKSCVAWAIEKETGQRLESSEISIEMAVKEGWYQKNGSKWQTMPEQMLRYRAASFFARIYSPELTMGMNTAEETIDAREEYVDVTPRQDITPKADDINALLQAEAAGYDPVTGEVQEETISKTETVAENATVQKEEKPLIPLQHIDSSIKRNTQGLKEAAANMIGHLKSTNDMDMRQWMISTDANLLQELKDKGLGMSHGRKIQELLQGGSVDMLNGALRGE